MDQSQSIVSEIPTVFEQEAGSGPKENLQAETLETFDSVVSPGSRQELKKSAISFQDRASIRSIDLKSPSGCKRYRSHQGVSPTEPSVSKILYKNKYITLTENIFGTIFDENLTAAQVKRYTWTNHNNIEIQIINYGARVTSMKLPDKKGNVQDIILGFDTLEGYVQNERHYFGATIGRMTGPVQNSTYVIDGMQYWISSNDEKHHVNGGFLGLDKVVWNSVVNKNKVIFSYIMPDGHEGFLGDLMVEMTFELSHTNEFSINMEARCTKTTIINLSNLCYFNLAGQNGGTNELRKHIVTINSCNHIVIGPNNLPTGKTAKSVFTRYDFQIPKVLNKCMDTGDQLNRGFDQYFCIDKDEGEDVCFVARALHTPSGRTLEIYSNQYAVRFTTANNLDGKYSSLLKNVSISGENIYDQLFMENNDRESNQNEKFLYLLDVYEKLKDLKLLPLSQKHLSEHLNLFRTLHSYNISNIKSHLLSTVLFKEANIDFKFFIIAIIKVINVIKNYVSPSISDETENVDLRSLIDNVSVVFTKLNELVMTFTQQVNVNFSQAELSAEKVANTLQELDRNLDESIDYNIGRRRTNSTPLKTSSLMSPKGSSRKNIVPWLWEELLDRVVRTVLSRAYSKSSNPSIVVSGIKSIQSAKIIGKQGTLYGKYTGMAFQTQNYPNAIYHKNFPSCVLRPNQVYNHKIIYKFWIQSGNPKKWMKRYESQ